MIKKWVNDLLTLSDQDWASFTFDRDPLVSRISKVDQRNYWQKSEHCALEMANKIRESYENESILSLAQKLGVKVSYQREVVDSTETIFAYFVEPDTITILLSNAELTDQLLEAESLFETLGSIKSFDLLIAHEMYHYLELITPNIYTAQKHLKLWKIGPFENRSRILCLEEIGAMAFAKELTGLKCSPYIYNVIMLYIRNPQKANRLYEVYMGYKN